MMLISRPLIHFFIIVTVNSSLHFLKAMNMLLGMGHMTTHYVYKHILCYDCVFWLKTWIGRYCLCVLHAWELPPPIEIRTTISVGSTK